jgi:hypothetical protein
MVSGGVKLYGYVLRCGVRIIQVCSFISSRDRDYTPSVQHTNHGWGWDGGGLHVENTARRIETKSQTAIFFETMILQILTASSC